MTDDKMQLGYKKLGQKNKTEVCDIWLEVWNDVLFIMNKGKIRSIEEFDNKFRG